MARNDTLDQQDSALLQRLEQLVREGETEPVPDRLRDLAIRLDGEIARRRQLDKTQRSPA